MDKPVDKKSVIEKLLNLAKNKEAEIGQACKDAQERANEAEGAMVSRYDTFKEEGQYLAGGLMLRHEELKKAVSIIDKFYKTTNFEAHDNIQNYSYVEIEFQDGKRKSFLITPTMGGESINQDIMIITPSSPVGKSLLGKEEGDVFQYEAGDIQKFGEIIRVL